MEKFLSKSKMGSKGPNHYLIIQCWGFKLKSVEYFLINWELWFFWTRTNLKSSFSVKVKVGKFLSKSKMGSKGPNHYLIIQCWGFKLKSVEYFLINWELWFFWTRTNLKSSFSVKVKVGKFLSKSKWVLNE